MNFYIFNYSQNVAQAPFTYSNTWHHLAGTWDQSTGVISIYLDGVLAGTDNYTGTIGPITTDVFQIGAAHSNYQWRNQLDEVRVWNIVRSQAEIQANMNTQLAGTEFGLLAYYKMEEGTGTILTDNSGHGNTGTMTAGVTWLGAPTISSISPASGTTGTIVTINGNLLTGTTAVTFGGTPATSFSVMSDAQITAVVGAGTTGDVVVNAPGGSVSYSGFTYAAACTNPTGGGTISGSQSICSGFVPAAFTSTAGATGHTGTLEYKWQVSTTGNSSGFADISSTNSTTYAPGALVAHSWFRRLARVNCMSDWTGAAASNVLEITVNQPSYVATVRRVSDLQATGEIIKWYATATGGTALATTDVLANGHYYASQTVNGVESTGRFDVTVTVDPTPCAPTANSPQTFGTGSTVAQLTTLTGQNIRWYDVATGGTAQPSATLLLSGTHTYYVTQTISCTESASRLAVTVTVN